MSSEEVPAVVAGRYRLLEVIGAGGMGTVWRAVDEVLGRDVAVKRVRLGDLPSADVALARERTMREARIAAALHHPNVVSIFDVVLEDGEPWLILEYVPSRSLGSILEEHGTLPPADIAAIGAQVAAALAAAHEAGVVHRDVKPDNVLVAHRPRAGSTAPLVKLTDFGISHAATAPAITATEVLTGTPAYFAPETARGEGTDPRTDVYSLGASLYSAAEGRPPFGTEPGNVLALLARVGRGQVPPPRNAGHLTGLLRWLTADDPAHRPTAAQAHHALLHAATPAPAAAPILVGPVIGRTVEPSRRRRKLITAVAGVLALVTVATIAVVANQGGAPDAAPAAAQRSTRPAAPATGLLPVTIDDPQTADPCSLLDPSWVLPYGDSRIDRHNVQFAGCRADIDRPGLSPVIFTAVFRGPEELVLPAGVAREPMDGRDVYPFPAAPDGSCVRQVVISPGYAVDVRAAPGGEGPAGDLCKIAEEGAWTAVRALSDGVIGTRPRMDTTTALGGTSACGLLSPADLAIVPRLRDPIAGFGDWECSWTDRAAAPTDVVLRFYRGHPLGESDGTPADFAGRPGTVLAGERHCRVHFVQHNYTAEETPRTEEVWVTVYGQGPGSGLCGTATTLATAAASKLPPPT